LTTDAYPARLRAAMITVAQKAPDLAPAMKGWSVRTIDNRMIPILIPSRGTNQPPELIVGDGWLDACGQPALERKVAELAYRATHGLIEAPSSMEDPEDRELWKLGIGMITHAALESRFPAASRDRELIETIATLVSGTITEAGAEGIFGALKEHEAEVDSILDTV
jgi:hypothetical protein